MNPPFSPPKTQCVVVARYVRLHSVMTGLIRRLAREDDGHGPLAYAVITAFFSVLVFRPELIAAAFYRLAGLVSLFVSQLPVSF